MISVESSAVPSWQTSSFPVLTKKPCSVSKVTGYCGKYIKYSLFVEVPNKTEKVLLVFLSITFQSDGNKMAVVYWTENKIKKFFLLKNNDNVAATKR